MIESEQLFADPRSTMEIVFAHLSLDPVPMALLRDVQGADGERRTRRRRRQLIRAAVADDVARLEGLLEQAARHGLTETEQPRSSRARPPATRSRCARLAGSTSASSSSAQVVTVLPGGTGRGRGRRRPRPRCDRVRRSSAPCCGGRSPSGSMTYWSIAMCDWPDRTSSARRWQPSTGHPAVLGERAAGDLRPGRDPGDRDRVLVVEPVGLEAREEVRRAGHRLPEQGDLLLLGTPARPRPGTTIVRNQSPVEALARELEELLGVEDVAVLGGEVEHGHPREDVGPVRADQPVDRDRLAAGPQPAYPPAVDPAPEHGHPHAELSSSAHRERAHGLAPRRPRARP